MVDSEELRVVLNCYRFIKNKKKLETIIKTGMPLGVYSLNAAILINVCLRLKLKLKVENGRVDMCKAMDDWRKEIERKAEKRGEKRGKAIGKSMADKSAKKQGKEIAIVRIVKKMLLGGVSIRDITRYTGTSSLKIREIAAAQNVALN